MAKNFSFSYSRIVFIFSLIGAFVSPLFSKAADFQIAPMLQEVILEQEGEARVEVTITNTTNAIGTFLLNVFDFGSLDESGGVAFLGASHELETKYSLASWMRPEKDSVTLLPGKSETIPVIIENRDSLSPGGHYGALVFESVDTPTLETPNTIAVKQMIASLVFVKKVGGAKAALDLASVEHEHSFFGIAKEATLRFHNPGNIHVVPRGTIKVKDPLGRVVYRNIINEASALVLPESFRLFPTSLMSAELAWIPGKYVFTVEYRFEEETVFRTWSKEFLLFPPLTLLVVLILAGVGGIFFFWRRFRGCKMDQTA